MITNWRIDMHPPSATPPKPEALRYDHVVIGRGYSTYEALSAAINEFELTVEVSEQLVDIWLDEYEKWSGVEDTPEGTFYWAVFYANVTTMED